MPAREKTLLTAHAICAAAYTDDDTFDARRRRRRRTVMKDRRRRARVVAFVAHDQTPPRRGSMQTYARRSMRFSN